MADPRKISMRTCIACREEKPKKELVRIVRTPEGSVMLDFSGKLAGRGAYVCKREACIKLLGKRKSLAKAFSIPVEDSVYVQLEEEYRSGSLRHSEET